MRTPLLFLGSWLALSTSSLAWWDTELEVSRPTISPPDREISAAAVAGGKGRVEEDAQADGGKGGKVSWLEKNGAPVVAKAMLQPGIVQWGVICRQREVGFSTPLFGLTVSKGGKEVARYYLPGRVTGFYGAVTFYVPIDEAGEYTFSLHLEGDSARLMEQAAVNVVDATKPRFTAESIGMKGILDSIERVQGVLIDRFELASLLPKEPLKQMKKQRYLSNEEAVAGMRLKPEHFQAIAQRPDAEDFSRHSLLVPPFNSLNTNGAQLPLQGLIRGAATYLAKGDEGAAMYASLLLCKVAELWPAIDYNAQFIGSDHTGLAKQELAPWQISYASTVGKHLYRGWAWQDGEPMIVCYDVLFDFIRTNPEFLKRVNEMIPYLKTSDDVVRFLDERLLWVSARDYQRCWIGRDTTPSLVARVFGPGPVSDEILKTTVFDRIQSNKVHLGGIDDNAVTTFSRDGVRFVGSSLYSGTELTQLVESFDGYKKDGGDPRFVLSSLPEGRAALLNRYSLSAMRMAGGFRAVTGDGGSLFQVREQGYETLPSRVLGSSGYTVLESGQEEENQLAKRAVAIYWGNGRGHAHSDTLNVELFAQGSRMAPDLGGREEGKFFGRPNMRKNRVHNLVEIDDEDFRNPALSIASATGWLVSFAPGKDGSQFAEHKASAQSHPQVSLYQRQTALISVPGEKREESYLFDVFRVRGGKTHSYNFHGGVTEALEINSELKPAEGHSILKDHKEGSRQEGVAAEVVDARWKLTPEMQEKYQGNDFEAGRSPVTRLLLFGQQGASVLVGNAYSDHYKYDFPFLYVRKSGGEAAESVYPAVVEMYAGEPFIRSAKLVSDPANTAEAPVAVAVETVSGRHDLLYTAGKPEEKTTLAGGAEVAGRFAFTAHRDGQVEEARLVGGTLLSTPWVKITTPAARIVRKLEKIDYPQRRLGLDLPLPKSLEGGVVTIFNGSRAHAFNLEAVKGAEVTLREYPGFYKSNLVSISPDGLRMTAELEAEQSRWDTLFAHNTVLTNEDHSRQWRVDSFEPGDMWMTMTFPGYRWSFPTEVALEDFPDKDGDGRRVVRLEGDPHTPKSATPEHPELEVTAVRNGRIYFRIPDATPEDSNLRKGGWSLNGFIMVPEGGQKRFYSRYSGQHLNWKIQETISKADFKDADGDGKIKVYAFAIGAGDRLEADTSVQVLYRPEAGVYVVEANTEATLTFPKGAAVPTKVSYGSVKGAALKIGADGSITLTPEMVDAGRVELHVSK